MQREIDCAVDGENDAGFRRRWLAVLSALFVAAQLLVAAHYLSVGDIADHSGGGCAICLAAAASDDPQGATPTLAAPQFVFALRVDPAPDAVLADRSVSAASPRAPPSFVIS